jgi:hypothetical protein
MKLWTVSKLYYMVEYISFGNLKIKLLEAISNPPIAIKEWLYFFGKK